MKLFAASIADSFKPNSDSRMAGDLGKQDAQAMDVLAQPSQFRTIRIRRLRKQSGYGPTDLPNWENDIECEV